MLIGAMIESIPARRALTCQIMEINDLCISPHVCTLFAGHFV